MTAFPLLESNDSGRKSYACPLPDPRLEGILNAVQVAVQL